MHAPRTITPAEIMSIVERLHPESLLVVRAVSGLENEPLQELWRKVAFTYDPPRRLAIVEYLLLIMHEAREKDPRGYLMRVFLPWMGIRRRLRGQVMRVADDIARTSEREALIVQTTSGVRTSSKKPVPPAAQRS